MAHRREGHRCARSLKLLTSPAESISERFHWSDPRRQAIDSSLVSGVGAIANLWPFSPERVTNAAAKLAESQAAPPNGPGSASTRAVTSASRPSRITITSPGSTPAPGARGGRGRRRSCRGVGVHMRYTSIEVLRRYPALHEQRRRARERRLLRNAGITRPATKTGPAGPA